MFQILRKNKTIFLIYLFFIILITFVVIFRNFNSDELGFYVSAAKLIREGYLPYRDFYFPQMPFSAYIYALTSVGGWKGIYLSRILAVCIFIAISIIFYSKRRSKRFLLLFLFNGSLIFFYPLAESGIFISFFLSILFILSFNKKNPFNLIVAGLILGVLTNIRYIYILSSLFFIPLGRRDTILFLAGFLSIFSVNLFFFSKAPYYYVFDNFYYHLIIRKEISPSLGLKILTIGKAFLAPQNLVIMIGFFMNIAKKYSKYYLFLFLINFIYFIILTPTQFHYLNQTLPIFLYLGIETFEKLNPKKFKILYTFYLIFGIIPGIYFYTPGFKQPQSFFMRKAISKMCEVVEKNTDKNDLILSEIPHIPYITKRKTIKIFRVTSSINILPFDEHLYSPYHLYLYVKKYKPKILIIHKDNINSSFTKNEYILIFKNGDYLIYKRREF